MEFVFETENNQIAMETMCKAITKDNKKKNIVNVVTFLVGL